MAKQRSDREPVLRPGRAHIQHPAGERSPGLARFILLTSLGVGALAGMAEVCWSYLLATFSEPWQAALPKSAAGLLSFAAAAVATDIVLVLAGGILLLILLSLLTRLTHLASASTRLRVLTRAAILGATLCYLYTGWIALLALCSGETPTLTYRLICVAGTVALLLLALLVSAALASAKRRWYRATPVTAWCIAVVILLIATAPPFWRQRASQDSGPDIAVSTAGPRPHVLLVTLDTLRGDYLGCYGHPWVKTPAVDGLAAEGAVFDAAISQAPSTTPSHCSIMTSVYPSDHGAENGRPMRRSFTTLADVLRAHGYETVAFTSATTTRSVNTGLHQGFERYVDSLVPWSEIFGRDEFQHLIFFYLVGFTQDSQIPGEVVTKRALRWLNNRSSKPFFAWLHYFDPHEPYGSALPFRNMYKGKIRDALPMTEQRERYAEDVTSADFQLGRFLDALKQRNLYDQTLIIVTSDHGEAFGEKHAHIVETGHGHYLSDVTQRVPLVIKLAAARLPARRVSEQVELIDVAPTVLSLLNIDAPKSFRGKPLDELLGGRPFSYAGRDAHASNVVRVLPSGSTKDDALYVQQLALRTKQWKYITRPRLHEAELYDLLEDPRERTNVAGDYPDVAGELHARIAPFWSPQRDPSENPWQGVDPALARELQALGYLGGGDNE